MLRCGDPSRAKATLERLEQQARTKYVDPFALAGLYGALNDKERLFGALEQGFKTHSPYMTLLLVHRRFMWKQVADDPRYLDLLKRMGFPRFQT